MKRKQIISMLLSFSLIIGQSGIPICAEDMQTGLISNEEYNDENLILETDEECDDESIIDEEIVEPETEIETETEYIFDEAEPMSYSEERVEDQKDSIVASGVCGENVNWELTEDGILTISGNGKMDDSVYRSKWKDYNVKKAIIEYGITSIGSYSFYQCKTLESVTLSESVTDIGNGAFEECSSLKSIDAENSIAMVSRVGDHAFMNCSKLKRVDLFNGWVSIGTFAFKNCGKLESVSKAGTLNIKELGRNAFETCPMFQDNVIIGNIEKIPESAFIACSSLKNVTLPNTLKTIEADAFGGCESLKSLIIPNGVIEIKLGALHSCGFDTITIPDSVEKIDNLAFENCKSLRKVYVKGKTEIEEGAFSGNTNFGFYILNNEFEFNEDPFYNVENGWNFSASNFCIWGITENVKKFAETHNYTFVNISSSINISNVKINKSYGYKNENDYLYTGNEIEPVYSVSYQASNREILLENGVDYSLTYSSNIELGKASVTISGLGYFAGNTTFEYNIVEPLRTEDITVEYSSTVYDGTEKKPGVTVRKNGQVLRQNEDYTLNYSNNTNEGVAQVTVTGIGKYRESNTYYYNIQKQDLSNAQISLSQNTYIYDGNAKTPDVTVYYGATILRKNVDYMISYANNINQGEGRVTISGIGVYKGEKSSSFTIDGIDLSNADIKLKNTIYTYDGSPKRPSVEVVLNGNSLVQGKDYEVIYQNNVNDGTAYAYVIGIGNYAGTESLSFAILPYNSGMDAVYEDGTLIGNNLLYGITDDDNNEVEVICPAKKNLSKITIPATVTCNGVIYKVTSIGTKAFYKNTKLKSVAIGNNVTSIENYAFYGCKNMRSLKIGSRVAIIGDSSFRKCTKLTSVTLPASMNVLGKNAFYGCSKLKSITLNANSVTDINANAIKGISKRATIKVPKKYLKKYKKKFSSKTGYKKSMKLKKK